MQLGMVGLGRMGANMAGRLRAGGHEVIGYDANPAVTEVPSLADLVAKLDTPRVVWVMIPVQFLEATISQLAELLSPGDIVVDGGNTRWTQDAPRRDLLAAHGVRFVDCGVSGGVWGPEYGYALMVGGDPDDIAALQPVFETLKPAGDAGFVHAGGHGAGHFAKMVHNGIEYSMMQAYAEGWELLEKTPLVTDAAAVVDSWREGTVIRSWLLDLIGRALAADPHLDKLEDYVDDSGEGRWTLQAAIDAAVPAPALAAALFARFSSREEDSPALKLVAALRQQFGGHAVRPADGPDGA
jgi:6-phosphogluconate dehydrogenase